MENAKVSKKKISFAGPSITQKEIDYAADAAKNGWYEKFDEHVVRLEKAVCSYLGMKYAIATHCCTHALHLANASLGLKAGDEVVCTDSSWVATAYSIEYTGAKPVFVDIEPDTWCISPKKLKQAITPKTKAIMLVHMFGHPAQMDEIMEIASDNSLKVIEDAAPSLGAKFKGKKTGTFGDVGCFSFHGAKIAACGEGGIYVTNNKELHDKALLLASHGRTDSKMTFWSDFIGYQYTMGNLSAAVALAQVERIEELVANKRRIFGWYDKRLGGVEGMSLIRERQGCFSNYSYPQLFLGETSKTSRDGIIAELKKRNIHTRPAFPRMSQFPVHEARFPTPVAEAVEKRGLSLPSAHNITEEEVDFVCEALFELTGAQKK